MTARPLTEAIFDRDIRRVNFFNGRILSAEDMAREQDADLEGRRRLGRAIGEGVAYGLEVSPTPGSDRVRLPVITITPGLAINRRGEALLLADPVDLSLSNRPTSTNQPAANGTGGSSGITTFEVCMPPTGTVYVAGAGLYLLTLGSVEGKEGRALASGLRNVEASCNTKYLVPGVRFRLTQLDLPPADLNTPGLLRNRVAYRCLIGDPPVENDFWANPFGPPVATYGWLDKLRPARLEECEVPLALLFLTAGDGLVFVDMWAVRRRITILNSSPSQAGGAESAFSLLTSDRRAAEGEAMFFQFQAQIQEMLLAGTSQTDGGLASISARNVFAYLPPVGLLPVGAAGQPLGFNFSNFFGQMTYRNPIFIEGAQLRPLLQEAIHYPPIDTGSNVVVWLYLVRENAQLTLSGKPAQSYLVFASGHTPYRGEPRYDVHHWNFGNFA